VVALGGNLPGAYASGEALFDAALAAMPAEGLVVVARSSWWSSAAWPDPTGPRYLNGVVLVETLLTPIETLHALHRIEAAFGRARGEANAARTLDLDLIAHGRVITEDGLTLPHPRADDRLFVMGPLAQIAPDWRHPVHQTSAFTLAGAARVGRDAAPIA